MVYRFSHIALMQMIVSFSFFYTCLPSSNSDKKIHNSSEESPQRSGRPLRRSNISLNNQLYTVCMQEETSDEQLALITQLLERGANPNWTHIEDSSTRHNNIPKNLLSRLTKKNALKIITLLFDYSEKNNVILSPFSNNAMSLSEADTSVLHIAAREGHRELCKLFIEALEGEGPYGLYNFVNFTDHTGDTPLHLAALNGHHEICSLLLKAGAEKNAKTRGGFTGLKNAAELTKTGNVAMTALQIAAVMGHEEACDVLIQHKADVSLQTKDGYEALHFAAGWGHRNICENLIGAGASVTTRTGRNGDTPLIIAVHNNQVDVVRLFLEDLQEEDRPQYDSGDLAWNGHPLLFWCAMWPGIDRAIARLLVKNGCRIDYRHKDFDASLLHIAVTPDEDWDGNSEEETNLEIAKFLIDQKLPVDSLDRNSMTPLHWAAWAGSLASCKFLVNEGASVTKKDSNDKTPIDIAFERNNTAVYNYLVEQSKNTSGRNSLVRSLGSPDTETFKLSKVALVSQVAQSNDTRVASTSSIDVHSSPSLLPPTSITSVSSAASRSSTEKKSNSPSSHKRSRNDDDDNNEESSVAQAQKKAHTSKSSSLSDTGKKLAQAIQSQDEKSVRSLLNINEIKESLNEYDITYLINQIRQLDGDARMKFSTIFSERGIASFTRFITSADNLIEIVATMKTRRQAILGDNE